MMHQSINKKKIYFYLLIFLFVSTSFNFNLLKKIKEIGLINDHYSISKLEDEVLKLAKKIASKSNLTIKIGKKAFYKQLEMPLNKAYKYASKMMTKNMMALDAREGISAFLEKRNPNWQNK